ncbi:MAG: hypothetical protein EA405_14065 [Rhodospirillales bacterium]|nr:MAG: hypothetical protein EA405_14065 [Rhodospirillales bacterium]
MTTMSELSPSLPQTAFGVIPDFCKDLRAVILALIGRSGVLLDANRGFIELLPPETPATRLLDIRDLFVLPRFDQLAGKRAGRQGTVLYQGMINLGDPAGDVVSLRAQVTELDDDLLLVAEHDIARLRQLNDRLQQLNHELLEQKRELSRLARQLEDHRSRGEAALRDRDALLDLLSSDRHQPH